MRECSDESDVFRGNIAKSNLEAQLENYGRLGEDVAILVPPPTLIFSPKEKHRFERLFDRHLVGAFLAPP
jgi:hypothetical protein